MKWPSGLALGASFDPELALRAGALLGQEARAKGFNVLLGGGMNLIRDPRNGRNFEYLSEDPLLTGVLAAQEVLGTQSQGVISTIKHYALNANETTVCSTRNRLLFERAHCLTLRCEARRNEIPVIQKSSSALLGFSRPRPSRLS